jgi:hypothetical protein
MKKSMLKAFIVLALCAVICLPGMAMANLVVNGGFETGNMNGWTTIPAPNSSAFGIWTGAAHSGVYGCYFGAYGQYDDAIVQNIPTVAGKSYTFDFWLAHNNTNNTNDFHVYWNGVEILGLINTASFGWTYYTFTEVATAATSSIKFAGREVPAQYMLDDVDVDAVPLSPTAILLGSGLLGLAGLRGFRKK